MAPRMKDEENVEEVRETWWHLSALQRKAMAAFHDSCQKMACVGQQAMEQVENVSDAAKKFSSEHPLAATCVAVLSTVTAVPLLVGVSFLLGALAVTFLGFLFLEGTLLVMGTFLLLGILLLVGSIGICLSGCVVLGWLGVSNTYRIVENILKAFTASARKPVHHHHNGTMMHTD